MGEAGDSSIDLISSKRRANIIDASNNVYIIFNLAIHSFIIFRPTASCSLVCMGLLESLPAVGKGRMTVHSRATWGQTKKWFGMETSNACVRKLENPERTAQTH